jgi:hypothetical protein
MAQAATHVVATNQALVPPSSWALPLKTVVQRYELREDEQAMQRQSWAHTSSSAPQSLCKKQLRASPCHGKRPPPQHATNMILRKPSSTPERCSRRTWWEPTYAQWRTRSLARIVRFMQEDSTVLLARTRRVTCVRLPSHTHLRCRPCQKPISASTREGKPLHREKVMQ